MKENHDIELLKTAESPITLDAFLSGSKSLKKLILDDVNISVISISLVDAKNFNSLTLMNSDVTGDRFMFDIQNNHITRYVFINVMFEDWQLHEIKAFLDTLVLNNKIIDTLIFRGCDLSDVFLDMLLSDVAYTNAPLQVLELPLIEDVMPEFIKMISFTNTIHALTVDVEEFSEDYTDYDDIILGVFRENVTITSFEYSDGLFLRSETKGLIKESIEYNIQNRNMYDVFGRPRPDISRFISQPEVLGLYLEREKELKKERLRPVARLRKKEKEEE